MTATEKPGRLKVRENDDAKLSTAQLRELSDQLVLKRREAVEAVSELNQHIATRQDCSIADAAEAANLREESARAAGIAAQYNQTIADIDRAMERLENGSYGFSEITGEPIAYQRLLLIPWARTGFNN
jgi:DnaK suppressor protein